MQIDIISNSPKDTAFIGRIIAKHIAPHMVIALIGPLAAGKTTLSKTIFDTKGYGDDFHSPTYTLINEYCKGENCSYHMDAYRISDTSELDYIGYEESLEDGEFIVIEWADLIEERLPEDCLRIEISYGDNDLMRKLKIMTSDTSLYNKLTEDLNAYTGN